MPLNRLFLFLGIITLVFVALQLLGYDVLLMIISMLIIDSVAVEVQREMSKHKNDLGHEVSARLANIENLMKSMVSHLESLPTMHHVYHIAEERALDHKTGLRDEFKNDLDKLATKAIEIENRLNQFKRTFSAAIASFDERIRAIETE